jgi:hypothetical protein
MAFKPHFVPLVMLALLAARQRQALTAMTGSVLAVSLTSLAVFGTAPWQAFLIELPDTTDMLFDGVFPVSKMQSVSALALSLGVSPLITQAMQALTTLGAAAFVFWLWRRETAFEYKAAGLGLAAMLATPYVYHHDLTVLGVALLFFAVRARRDGWLAGERGAMAVAFGLPLAAFALGVASGIALGALVLLTLAIVIVRRVQHEGAAVESAVRPAIAAA